MGTGSVYPERGQWVAQISVGPRGQRQKIRRTRRTRREAVQALAELRAERHPERPKRLTLSELLVGWVRDVRNLRPATRHAYANAIDYHLVPTLGHIRLADLSPLDVERALATIGERVGPKSLRNIHAVLRRALGQAVRAGLIDRNVASREFVDAPRVPSEEPRALSLDEVRRMLDALRGDRLEALYVLAVGTGLRQGELLGLAWEDVEVGEPAVSAPSIGEYRSRLTDDQELRRPFNGSRSLVVDRSSREPGPPSGMVSVRRELVRRDGRYYRDELKTRHSRRAVPLAPAVVDALRAHRERFIADGFVPTATSPIFTNLEGGPLNGGWLTHHFYRVLDRAGIRRLPFHNLRATYASRLAEAGVSDIEIARLLGHSRTHTARKHYIAAGAVPDAVLATVERMVG